MGCRLHSATKYEVEYGSNACFNWGQNHLNGIIECLADGDFWCNDHDCIDGADTLEASRENLRTNIEYIITPNPEWESQETLDELIEDMENDKHCDIDRAYLYKQLKALVEQADARETYVHFSWF